MSKFEEVQSKFDEIKEKQVGLRAEISDQIYQLRKMEAQLQDELIVGNENKIKQIEQKIKATQEKIDLLQRREAAFTDPASNPLIIRIADDCHAELKSEAKKLKEKYGQIYDRLLTAKKNYMSVVTEIAALYQEDKSLRAKIGVMRDLFPKFSKTYIESLPSVNTRAHKGPVFMNNHEVSQLFKNK